MNSFCGKELAPLILAARDDRFSNVIWFLCIVNIATAIVTVMGNLSVVIAIWRTPSLHRPSFVLLSGLALSDLGVGLISQPFFVAHNMVDSHNCSLFYVYFKVHEYFANQLIYVTFLTLCATAVERFLALKIHLRYKELVTVRKTLFCLFLIWITASIREVWKWIHRPSAMIGGIILGFGASSTTVICYIKIFRIVRYHQTQIRNQIQIPHQGSQATIPNIARYRKSLRTLFYVVCFFCLSYLPWLFLGIAIKAVNKGITVEILFVSRIFYTTSSLNSCFNPFLYCWRMEEIRQAIKEQLKLLRWKNSGN